MVMDLGLKAPKNPNLTDDEIEKFAILFSVSNLLTVLLNDPALFEAMVKMYQGAKNKEEVMKVNWANTSKMILGLLNTAKAKSPVPHGEAVKQLNANYHVVLREIEKLVESKKLRH